MARAKGIPLTEETKKKILMEKMIEIDIEES